jgi:hypothetical protein
MLVCHTAENPLSTAIRNTATICNRAENRLKTVGNRLETVYIQVDEAEAQARRRSLARKHDFLLVPTTLYSDGQGNVSKKAVMFQAKSISSTFR